MLVRGAPPNLEIKLTDLGLARSTGYTPESRVAPVRWSAPEVLRCELQTELADSFSMGVVAWEVYSIVQEGRKVQLSRGGVCVRGRYVTVDGIVSMLGCALIISHLRPDRTKAKRTAKSSK